MIDYDTLSETDKRHMISELFNRAEKAEAALAREMELHEKATFREVMARTALATAQAVMAEEAARAIHAHGSMVGVLVAQAQVRALAPLPAGLMVLPVEVMREVREALEWGRIVCIRNRDEAHLPKIESARVKAFAALDAAGGETK